MAPNYSSPKSTDNSSAKHPVGKPVIRKKGQPASSKKEIAELKKEMKTFADELLAGDKISPQEYKELMDGLKAETMN
jgi:hypothetical protein